MSEVLRGIAARLGQLKASLGQETTPINFAVGATFALLKAETLRYVSAYETGRSLRIWARASTICEDMAKGMPLPTDDEWLAGYFFNDAIIRIAVAFEHLVRHEIPCDEKDRFAHMEAKAAQTEGFREEWLKSWDSLYKELNSIRHKPNEFDGPTVEYKDAVAALLHLTEALEWASARRAVLG